ncbi:tyrosine-protein phosphatase [Thiohalorhabdus methylotrophus]|uniref:Tyrosine-protein phosphatase n=1 Tax=Thiohalorhabdus methylotrophus TaxID=3242694 RepID=A0ABV4TY81_9GAMM
MKTEETSKSAFWSLAHARAFFVDHGFLRKVNNNNFHRISHRAFRSGQPLPPDLKKYVSRHGIRTVVCLRGTKGSRPYIDLVERMCGDLGVTFRNFKMSSHKPPPRWRIHAAKELLEEIEYPALFHCKSGADRAGLFSTLYLHLMEGVPMDRTRQLRFWPYGHIRQARTGILDHFVESYVAYSQREPMDFMTWVDEVYDPDALKDLEPAGFMSWFVDRVLRRE